MFGDNGFGSQREVRGPNWWGRHDFFDHLAVIFGVIFIDEDDDFVVDTHEDFITRVFEGAAAVHEDITGKRLGAVMC